MIAITVHVEAHNLDPLIAAQWVVRALVQAPDDRVTVRGVHVTEETER